MKKDYTSKPMFICTECGDLVDHVHGERWNCDLGFIIEKDEKLCDECAVQRPGFKTLSDINNERKNS